MTIRVRISNEDPAGGAQVVRILPSFPHASIPEVRLSGGQSFFFQLYEGAELHITEADREPSCDGPAAPNALA